MTTKAATPDQSDREIVISRLVNAPRELVWKAYSDPEHLTHWWGPDGFSTTTKSMDMRPGGEWRFVMHGPDGTDFKNLVKYIEVTKPERLVWNHSGEDETAHIHFTSYVTFADESGKTRVTIRLVCDSKAERDEIEKSSGATEGGKQTLARLDQYLHGQSLPAETATGTPFVIERTFNAPLALVWKVWTEADHLKNWWGPKGCKLEVKSLDVRPGGIFHYAMRFSNGAAMWGRFDYIEIGAPNRMTYFNAFSDETGGITRAPFSATWPLQIHNTLTLEERREKTVMTITGYPHNATDEERRFFEGFFHSMEKGFGGTMDQLDVYLATLA